MLEGLIRILLTSDEIKNRTLSLELDPSIFEGQNLDDFIVYLDGKPLRWSDIEDQYRSGSVYNLEERDGKYYLNLFIEDASRNVVSVGFEDEEDSTPDIELTWYMIAFVGTVLLILLLVIVSMLTMAQRKRKIQAFYEDFDLGRKGGSPKREDEDIEWDELLE
jgi:hypothetical protein